MSTTRYYLWRHGQSRYNAGETAEHDSSMTPKGWEQAKGTANRLRYLIDKDWKVFVSPYLRTLQTASCLEAYRIGCRFVVDPRICENVDELHDRDRRINAKSAKCVWQFDWPPDDEFNFNKMTVEGYKEGMKKFVAELPPKAVIVSHMTTIEHLIRFMVNDPDLKFSQPDNYIGNSTLSLIADGKALYLGKDS